MDGFKNTTKTHYMKGGACEGYAKGGSVKGAAKISKVMGEFKSGKLHSGSKSGPDVTNPKQAVAIALSEARKAGEPVAKKAMGGKMAPRGGARNVVAPRPAPRPATLPPAMQPPATLPPARMNDGGAVARGNRMSAMEAREEAKLMREARDSRKVTPRSREVVSERRMTQQRDVREPLIRTPLMGALSTLPSARGEMPIRRKNGGLAAMPRGKKC